MIIYSEKWVAMSKDLNEFSRERPLLSNAHLINRGGARECERRTVPDVITVRFHVTLRLKQWTLY